MPVLEFKIQVLSRKQSAFVDITAELNRILREKRWEMGLLNLFVKHTTCGLTVNENADPNVLVDLTGRLEEMIPWSRGADRHLEGNSAAHLKSSFFGTNLTLPVSSNKLSLGTWQGVYLAEFDGPKTRTVHLNFIQ